jgi:ubiquinone/menaquinone biosynthesis C-methylase UbiE
VVSDYFSAEAVDSTADVITSAAMFYDVDDPHKFLADISRTLKPDGVWINQLNDSPTMLQANAWDAVCHEHLCYYDLPTLARMYAEHGLGIVGVSTSDVNGGSIRVVAVHGKHTIKIPDLLRPSTSARTLP